MAFFGKNTARDTRAFANDMSAFRQETEDKASKKEIEQVASMVLQFFSGLSEEEQADPANTAKIAKQIKSLNVSDRARVAGIAAAQGYVKSSLDNQGKRAQTANSKQREKYNLAATTGAENTNAATADMNAVQTAFGDPTTLGKLTPKQLNMYNTIKTEQTRAADKFSMDNKVANSRINASNAATGASNLRGQVTKSQLQTLQDQAAVQGAFGEVAQNPAGIPFATPKARDANTLNNLTPRQAAMFASQRAKNQASAEDRALANSKTTSEVNKNISVTNKNNRGVPADLKAVYKNSAAAIQAQVGGLVEDQNGIVGGNFKLDGLRKLQAIAKDQKISLYTEEGVPIDEHFWNILADDTRTYNVKLMPPGTTPTDPAKYAPPAPQKIKPGSESMLMDSKYDLPIAGPTQTTDTMNRAPQGNVQLTQPAQPAQPAQPNSLEQLRQRQSGPTISQPAPEVTPFPGLKKRSAANESFVAAGNNLGAVTTNDDAGLKAKVAKKLSAKSNEANVAEAKRLLSKLKNGGTLTAVEKMTLDVLNQAAGAANTQNLGR